MSPPMSLTLPLVILLLSVGLILPVRATSNFALALDPSLLEIVQGSFANSTIRLTNMENISDTIIFSMTGENWTFYTQLSANETPTSTNRTFLPRLGSQNVTLTINVPSYSPPGCCHILNITGTGQTTGTSQSAILNVTVKPSSTNNSQLLTILFFAGSAGVLFLITALTIILLRRSRRIVRHPFVP